MVEKTQRKWLALALLATVQFMVVLDIAIVNVALPSIQVDLGFTPENLQSSSARSSSAPPHCSRGSPGATSR